MEQLYRRVDDLDEKIKEITLPYLSWKILFLISEETDIAELKKQLKKDKKEIEDALALLSERGLVMTGGQEETGEESPEPAQADVESQAVAVEEESADTGEEELSQEESTPVELKEEKEDEQQTVADTETEEITEDLQEMALEDSLAGEAAEKTEEPEDVPVELPEVEVDESEEETPETEEEAEDVSLEEKEDQASEPAEESVDLTLEETVEDQPDALKESSEQDIEIEEREEDSVDLDFDEPQVKDEEITGAAQPESAEMTNLIEELDEMGGSGQKSGADETAAAGTEKEKKAAGGKTIMVIDDSIVIRKMVEIALEEDDFRIVTAISGKEGMTVLDEEKPDLVILDMMLPDMNGIDVLKTIKASKGIPVIMLSGKDSPQLIETAKGVGADDFLPKPFRDEELVEKVKNLLK